MRRKNRVAAGAENTGDGLGWGGNSVHSCKLGLARTRPRVVHAKRALAIACRPSVTVVDCDHIGWKSWKLTAQTFSPAPSLFVAKGDPPTPRGTWGNFWEIRGGVGRGVLESKSAAISLKHVKIEEKLLWTAYSNSPTHWLHGNG